MERFSADHIRQQPEYRFLMYKDKSQVIQTCVEDGEIKIRLGQHPTPAKSNDVNTSRPTSGHNSTKSGASSTVSNVAVRHSTVARAHSSAAADRPASAETCKTRQRKLGVVTGKLYDHTHEDRNFQDHRLTSTAATNRSGEIEEQKENEEYKLTTDDSKDDCNANKQKNHSGCKIKGNPGISDEAQNKAASNLRQGREIAEKNGRTESNETDNSRASDEPLDNRKITNGDSDRCTKQTAEPSLTIGQTSVNENRNPIKDCNTGISFTPEENTAGQSTNKRSSSHLKKQGGITQLSADTESTHVTEREHDNHFTDPAIQATKKDITEGKACGITEQERPSHTIKEDKKYETKIKDHSTYDSESLQAGGETDGVKQNGQHNVSAQVKVEDSTHKETSSYLAHSSMKRIQTTDGFANIVEDKNEINGVNSSLCEYKHTDDVVPDVDKVLKKENVQTKVSSIKKNEKTKPKVKAPSMSRPAVNQQTSKENSAIRSKNTQGKFQKSTKKSEMMISSRKKSSDTAKLEHGKENEFVTQQTKPADHQPQSSTWHLDSTSKAPSAQNSLCNHRANLRTASKNQQERRKLKCFSGDKRERPHSPITQMSLDTYDKENCSDLIVSQQNATRPYETPITDAIAGANDRIMDRVSCQIVAKYSAASDHVSPDRIQGARISQSGEDRYSMAGSAGTHAEDEDQGSEILLEYPRPVTRVDVRETAHNNDKTNKTEHKRPGQAENHQGKTNKSSRNGNGVATSTRESLHRTFRTVSGATAAHRANHHSETDSKGSHHVTTEIIAIDPRDHHPERSLRMNGQGVESVFTNRTQNSPKETDNTPNGITDPSQEFGVASFMDQGKENALLTCFTIPAIVVDKASTIGDASNYSDDIDAVLIDAEEYLAFVQNGQAVNQDSSLAQSRKQKNQYWQQLANHHDNAEWMLDIPPNPELPGEQIPYSKSSSSQHVLKPGLENTHKYNSSAALELSGLRTTLTPSPYNIEFQPSLSHGRRSPLTDLSLQSGTAKASPYTSSHSPRPSTSDCTFPGRTSSSVSKLPGSKPTGTFLAPQSPEGSKPGSHKSAMGNRRSSLNSVGMVHWDQAVTDPPALGRQISWEENIPDSPARPLPRRRHSSALGIRHEKLLDMSAQLVVTQLSSASEPSMGRSLALESSPEYRRHSVACTALDDPTGERKLSTASALSTGHSQRSSVVNQEELDMAELDRQASQRYDPKVEKSRRYNHQMENDAFNKACQWLSPVRRGLRTLQVQYSQTNTTHNDSLIFAHLLRAAHVKNAAVEDAVYNTERRLYTRRHTDAPHATTFFDTPPGDHTTTRGGKGKKNETARRSSSASTGSKGYSTVAKKKKERRERIKKKNEELELGYTPRAQSLRVLGPEDIEAILTQCRHLRVSPQLQQHLYNTDIPLLEEPLESTATSLA